MDKQDIDTCREKVAKATAHIEQAMVLLSEAGGIALQGQEPELGSNIANTIHLLGQVRRRSTGHFPQMTNVSEFLRKLVPARMELPKVKKKHGKQ